MLEANAIVYYGCADRNAQVALRIGRSWFRDPFEAMGQRMRRCTSSRKLNTG